MALVIGTGSGVGSGTMVMLSKEYICKIENPHEVENKFTVKTEKEANEIMIGVGIDDLDKLKGLLEGIDFTSVSTRQLGRLAGALYEMGYPDLGGMGFLSRGNMDCGPDGLPRNKDVKFNAIALMHEQLNGHVESYDKEPRLKTAPYSRHVIPSLICINQVVGAMAYFARAVTQPATQNPSTTGLIDERA